MEERSAGAVVFRDGPAGERIYLLLQNAGHWDFPKGGRERGESEVETVLREVGEETGLKDVRLISGFRRVIEYFYRRNGANVHKEVTYLLARSAGGEVKISKEHQGFAWYSYDAAMKRASYDNSRRILGDAEAFIRTQDGPV